MGLHEYRASEDEQARLKDLLELLPRGRRSILEIGARDGYHSRILTDYFEAVTALDLEMPDFRIERVTNARGDVTALEYPDESFDCVLCAEVLEHVGQVELAAAEITRVARHEILVGVPYRQDTRVGKSTCRACGTVNPPYGHLNVFDETRLSALFPSVRVVETRLVGATTARTNAVSSALMTFAGNPWGTYDQDEPCIRCGTKLRPPASRTLLQSVASKAAHELERLQHMFVRPAPSWIHVLFLNDGGGWAEDDAGSARASLAENSTRAPRSREQGP